MFPPPSSPLADASVEWTSIRVERNRIVPESWGEFRSSVLFLKDTHRGMWQNRLEAPNRFVYVLPKEGKYHKERQLCGAIRQRHADGRALRVHLYATPGSRQEYYGEWEAVGLKDAGPTRMELVLGRLETQPDVASFKRKRDEDAFRSNNERAHHRMLLDLFPEAEWIVEHEMDTLTDLHAPSVVNGVPQALELSTYTCDFLVAGLRDGVRFYVESKDREEAVDAKAREKCRLLRDRTLSRVFVAAGRGADVRWLDFGPPRSKVEEERWHDIMPLLVERGKK